MRSPGVLVVALFLAACASPEVSPNKVAPGDHPKCGHGGLDNDPHNCGSCGHDCSGLPGLAPNATVQCVLGVCDLTGACAPNHAHCSDNPDDGCEADLTTPEHCGACGTVCPGTAGKCTASSSGDYQCSSSCGGATPDACGTACVDTHTDLQNCGTCGHVCPAVAHATATCAAGSCGATCDTGFVAGPMGGCVLDMSPSPSPSPSPPSDPNWTVVASNTTHDLLGVWGDGHGEVYVVGKSGTILHASAGGSFVRESISSTNTLLAVSGFGGFPESVGYFGSSQRGGVYETTVSGSWVMDGSFPTSLDSVWGTEAGDAWIVGAGGAILRWDGVAAWIAESSPTTRELWSVSGTGADNVYAVGSSGAIVRTDGSGTWIRESSHVSNTLYNVWAGAPNQVYAVGTGGTALSSPGDGTWSALTTGTTADLGAAWSSTAGDLWVVGDGGLILHAPPGGALAPETSHTTSMLWAIWGGASDGLYAVGEGGIILHRGL